MQTRAFDSFAQLIPRIVSDSGGFWVLKSAFLSGKWIFRHPAERIIRGGKWPVVVSDYNPLSGAEIDWKLKLDYVLHGKICSRSIVWNNFPIFLKSHASRANKTFSNPSREMINRFGSPFWFDNFPASNWFIMCERVCWGGHTHRVPLTATRSWLMWANFGTRDPTRLSVGNFVTWVRKGADQQWVHFPSVND